MKSIAKWTTRATAAEGAHSPKPAPSAAAVTPPAEQKQVTWDPAAAQRIAELEALVARKDEQLAGKDEQLAQKDVLLALKDEQLARNEADIEALRLELALNKAEEGRLRGLAAAGTKTVRELIQGRALSSIPLAPQLGGVTVNGDKPSASASKKRPTEASEWWMPFAPHNARHWTDAEFAAHLKTAERLTVDVNGEYVKVLDMVLDAYPDERTANKLNGTIATEMFAPLYIMEENRVESLLLKTHWDPLEVTLGQLEPARKYLKTEVLPGKSRLVKVDPQYDALYKPDDTITAVFNGPAPDNETLGDVLNDAPSATGGLGNITAEVKVPVNCPYPLYEDTRRNQKVNDLIRGHLVDYAKAFKHADRFNPLRQLATYLLLQRMVFGVVTTLNSTTFVVLELVDVAAPADADPATLGWRVAATKKFDVCAVQPLESEPWSLFEVWMRFILASIGTSRFDKVPDGIKQRFLAGAGLAFW